MPEDGVAQGEVDSDIYLDASVSALRAIVNAVSDSTKEFLEVELSRLMNDKNVKVHIKEVMPYVYAAGFLSFSGREINQESIAKTLGAVGLTADPVTVKLLFQANIRSHLAYIYAYYFLLALGRIGSESEILSLVNSLGIEADPERLKDVLAFLRTPAKNR